MPGTHFRTKMLPYANIILDACNQDEICVRSMNAHRWIPTEENKCIWVENQSLLQALGTTVWCQVRKICFAECKGQQIVPWSIRLSNFVPRTLLLPLVQNIVRYKLQLLENYTELMRNQKLLLWRMSKGLWKTAKVFIAVWQDNGCYVIQLMNSISAEYWF